MMEWQIETSRNKQTNPTHKKKRATLEFFYKLVFPSLSTRTCEMTDKVTANAYFVPVNDFDDLADY